MKDEHEITREAIIEAVIQHLQDENAEEAKEIADQIMKTIHENYRSITEIQDIVEAVRLGMGVGVAYAEVDEEPDPYTVRGCW